MPFFDNPFTPDLGFRRSGCSCGAHESEFEHEKAMALAQSREARRRFIAESFRDLFRQRHDGTRPAATGPHVRMSKA